jgi:hypothetical protein
MTKSLDLSQNASAQQKTQQKSQGNVKANSSTDTAVKKSAVTTLIKYLEKK